VSLFHSQVVCGASHTAAVASTGAVYVWNCELKPRLVRLAGGHDVVSLAASRYTIYAVTSEGLLFSWAEHWHANHTPRPNLHADLRCVAHVAAAEQHCAALVAVRRPPPHTLPWHTASAEADSDDETEAPAAAPADAADAAAGRGGCVLPSLKRLCERVVATTLTPRNVLDFANAADAIVAPDLGAAARSFVRHNLPLLLRKPLWTYLPATVLEELSREMGGGAGAQGARGDESEGEEEGGGVASPSLGPTLRARQLRKKLKQIEALERRGFASLTTEQRAKVRAFYV